MAEKTYYATRPFFWAGKSIVIGDAISLNPNDAKWMLGRGAVTETAPKKPATKSASKKK